MIFKLVTVTKVFSSILRDKHPLKVLTEHRTQINKNFFKKILPTPILLVKIFSASQPFFVLTRNAPPRALRDDTKNGCEADSSRTSNKNVRVDTHLSVEEVAEVEEGEGVGEEWKRKKKE